jgi:uncharacterized protein with HEPN domain
MREPIRDRSRLEHILEAISRLQTYAGDLSKEELEQDVLRYYGIVKNIEIIGEAARMLTNAFKTAHAEVNWRSIANMRNFLVHEYFQVDSDVVWSVIHKEIAPLREQVVRHLSETDWEAWEQTSQNENKS